MKRLLIVANAPSPNILRLRSALKDFFPYRQPI